MPRTAVVTGAASGIGRATKSLLEARGERVIGVDLHDTDIEADLSTTGGRAVLVEEVRSRSGGRIDAVYAVAGISQPVPATAAINYFGAVATLDGLRPLLEASPAPRAVAVSSMAAVFPVDEELVDAMLSGDEAAGMSRAEGLASEGRGHLIYTSSKRALSRWVRQRATGADWAGASIPLNAVAPGTIATPMSAPFTATAEATAKHMRIFPSPLNGIAPAEAAAELLAWLGSEANTHLCGQVLYLDGGSDAVIRGDAVW